MEPQTKEGKIGLHMGALQVLANEKQAFMQMLAIVQQHIQMHVKALKELGVDLEAEAKKAKEAARKEGGVENKVA